MEPIVVLIDLPEVPKELLEVQVQEALRERFPGANVEVVPVGTVALPPGAVAAMQRVLSRGPAGMLADLQEMLADPERSAQISEVFGHMQESMPLAGEERAPDYPPEG